MHFLSLDIGATSQLETLLSAGCGDCVKSHERAVLEGGLTEDHVHDAIRIASVVHGFALSLALGA